MVIGPYKPAAHCICSAGVSSKKAEGTKLSEFMLRIDGMHCGSCVRRVTQALNLSEGVEVVEVQIGAARLRSALEPAPVERAIAALAKAGYSARLDQ